MKNNKKGSAKVSKRQACALRMSALKRIAGDEVEQLAEEVAEVLNEDENDIVEDIFKDSDELAADLEEAGEPELADEVEKVSRRIAVKRASARRAANGKPAARRTRRASDVSDDLVEEENPAMPEEFPEPVKYEARKRQRQMAAAKRRFIARRTRKAGEVSEDLEDVENPAKPDESPEIAKYEARKRRAMRAAGRKGWKTAAFGDNHIDAVIDRLEADAPYDTYDDAEAALTDAMDSELIYSDDVWEIARYYLTDSDVVDKFYEEWVGDIYNGIDLDKYVKDDDEDDDYYYASRKKAKPCKAEADDEVEEDDDEDDEKAVAQAKRAARAARAKLAKHRRDMLRRAADEADLSDDECDGEGCEEHDDDHEFEDEAEDVKVEIDVETEDDEEDEQEKEASAARLADAQIAAGTAKRSERASLVRTYSRTMSKEAMDFAAGQLEAVGTAPRAAGSVRVKPRTSMAAGSRTASAEEDLSDFCLFA